MSCEDRAQRGWLEPVSCEEAEELLNEKQGAIAKISLQIETRRKTPRIDHGEWERKALSAKAGYEREAIRLERWIDERRSVDRRLVPLLARSLACLSGLADHGVDIGNGHRLISDIAMVLAESHAP